MFRLNYLTANAAWVFTFGDQLLRLENEDLFYSSRADAVVAASYKGLKVSRQGVVEADGPNPAERVYA